MKKVQTLKGVFQIMFPLISGQQLAIRPELGNVHEYEDRYEMVAECPPDADFERTTITVKKNMILYVEVAYKEDKKAYTPGPVPSIPRKDLN